MPSRDQTPGVGLDLAIGSEEKQRKPVAEREPISRKTTPEKPAPSKAGSSKRKLGAMETLGLDDLVDNLVAKRKTTMKEFMQKHHDLVVKLGEVTIETEFDELRAFRNTVGLHCAEFRKMIKEFKKDAKDFKKATEELGESVYQLEKTVEEKTSERLEKIERLEEIENLERLVELLKKRSEAAE